MSLSKDIDNLNNFLGTLDFTFHAIDLRMFNRATF